jgi:hypothetical protein
MFIFSTGTNSGRESKLESDSPFQLDAHTGQLRRALDVVLPANCCDTENPGRTPGLPIMTPVAVKQGQWGRIRMAALWSRYG